MHNGRSDTNATMTKHYPPKESNKVTSQENTPQRKRNGKNKQKKNE